MIYTIVAIMKSKMIPRCVSSGEMFKAWKCIPIMTPRIELRKIRNTWNASKKATASSLAHTQTKHPLALKSVKLLWFLFWGLQSNLKREKRRNREIKPNLFNVWPRVAQIETLKRIAKSTTVKMLKLVENKRQKNQLINKKWSNHQSNNQNWKAKE